MKNLKIGMKFVVTFGIIITMSIITVALSIFGLSSTGTNFEEFYSNGFQITNAGMDMRRNIQSGAKYIGFTSMEKDSAKTQQYIDAAEADFKSLREGIQFMRENFRGDQALVEECQALLDKGADYRAQIFNLAKVNRNDEAAKIYFEQYQPILIGVQDNLVKIYDVAMTNANDNYKAANDATSSITIMLIIVSIVLIITTVALALYLTRSLNTPIREIENAAKELATGNLEVSVSYQSKDELGSLSQNIRTLIDNVKGIIEDMGDTLSELGKGNFTVESYAPQLYVGDFKALLDSTDTIILQLTDAMSQISQSSEQVSSGSDQVSSGAQALSQGATEQALSVEELAATITEISEHVKRNAENAQAAKKESEQAAGQVSDSNDQMQQMIVAMNDISGKSAEISKIIKTIEDIAFQTNILALNAALRLLVQVRQVKALQWLLMRLEI